MKNIQLVNYSGRFKSEIFQINSLSSPEAFDDYDYNVIDLSDGDIWSNVGSNLNSINCISDLKSIASMIKKTKNKVLVILPQNVRFRYNWNYAPGGGKNYTQSAELKNNLAIINLVIETLIGNSFKNSWLMYNKTKSKIYEDIISSDFVFQNITNEQSVTFSSVGTSVTCINYLGLFFTTLNLKSEKIIMNYLTLIGWMSRELEIEPEWMKDIKIFNDLELEGKKENNLKQIELLKEQNNDILQEIYNNHLYKTILYKTGDELVEVVNIMLKEMLDYQYENFEDVKEEDFLIECENTFFIGEIKGISSNIKRSNVLQAAMHRTLYLEIPENENKNVIAIAIINRQRSLHPNERDSVTTDVVKLAKTNDVLLITAETFLSLYEKFKYGRLNKSDIINLLSLNKGLLEI